MSQTYRNHPAALVKNLIFPTFILLIVCFSSGTYYPMLALAALIPLMVVAWFRTHLTVYDDHAVAESRIISVKTRTIPFGKVASVNEVKGVFGRIFGWTTVQININSSSNAARPEISFTLSDEVAARIVPLLKFGNGASVQDDAAPEEPEVRPEGEPLFSFGSLDAVAFGILGSNTYSLLFAIIWGTLTTISTFSSAGLSVVTILMFVSTGIFPMVSSILKHGNFRVYRSGNTIRMVHGLMTIYDTVFEVERVNAVCIKRALFPRMFGRCCIQAEVVGINADAKSITPNITLLIPESKLESAMRSLFPEFIRDYEVRAQPPEAAYPTFSRATYFSLAWVGLVLLSYHILILSKQTWDVNAFWFVFVVAGAAVPILLYLHGFLSLNARRMGCGDRMFTSVNGVIDSSEYTMQYSKVQITGSVASPMARRHGVARMDISLLTAQGGVAVRTGFFPAEYLDTVADRSVELSGDRLEPIDVGSA